MPEFDVVVLVPVKRRIVAPDLATAHANCARVVSESMRGQQVIDGYLVPATITPVPESEWSETRIDILGQNGNEGEHY